MHSKSAILLQLARQRRPACSAFQRFLASTVPKPPATSYSARGRRYQSTGTVERAGSQYEDYESTSQTYDSWRRPIDIGLYKETLAEAAGNLGKAVSELKLLEAGCGTANYSHTLASTVGEVVGLEYSEGMLAKAKEKCEPVANISLMQGNICDMNGIQSESMDAVMVNQVLHHLYSASDTFEPTKAAVRELARVVRPGGAVMIQTQTPQQHRLGFWWADLVPAAASELAKRFPSSTMLEEILCGEMGMVDFKTNIPDKPLVRTGRYRQILGPFDEQFRAADSTWALVSESELETGLARLRTIIDQGRGDEYMADREAIRSIIGQTTTLVAFKPL